MVYPLVTIVLTLLHKCTTGNRPFVGLLARWMNLHSVVLSTKHMFLCLYGYRLTNAPYWQVQFNVTPMSFWILLACPLACPTSRNYRMATRS